MVLWKLALLRRRILIFSPPPVGVVCYRGEQQTHGLATRGQRLFHGAAIKGIIYFILCNILHSFHILHPYRSSL